jgi:MoaA/NifB/PqqE/SkfB family radical SAM enzyme
MEKNKFCIRPYNSINITTDGSIKVCCDARPNETEFKGQHRFNLKQNDIVDYWNSDYRQYLINAFKENKTPKECRICWEKEAIGSRSLRQNSNFQYKVIGNKKAEEYLKLLGKENLEHPEDYNLDITNLCNLKCYMCSGTLSSKLLVENNDLGFEKLDQKNYDYDDSRLDYLIEQIEKHNVTHITLQGGEPLMNPKIIQLLEKLSWKKDLHNLAVWITTNGTIYNDDLHKLLERFRNLKIIFSIDGIDKVNDYLRFPSNFETIKYNVQMLRKLKNATFMINHTVQNFNLMYIKDMIDYANAVKIHCNFNILEGPDYLHLRVLPKKSKEKSLERLLGLQQDKLMHTTNFDALIKNIKQNLDSDVYRQIERFKQVISKRDAYRKIELSNFIPELAKDLNI